MLKQVRVNQLKAGMHLHKLEGRWTDHPFWRPSFVIEDKDLAKLLGSGIVYAWIDTEKGQDVDPVNEPAPFVNTELMTQPMEAFEPISLETPEVRYVDMPMLAPEPMPVELETPDVEEMDLESANALCTNATAVLRKVFADIRLGRALDSEQCAAVVSDVVEHVMGDVASLMLVVRLKNHDSYSHMHSVAVCALMVALGQQIGLNRQQMCEAGMAGLLHDVGKLMVPTEILNKPAALTSAEYRLVKTHVERGVTLLKEAGMRNEMVLDACLHHHERMDGSGYPHRLRGEEISLFSKMAAVCDVYDALTSQRPHRARSEPGSALRQMMAQRGQFDPLVLQAFVKTVGIYPVGSLVRLESDQLAIVVAQENDNLLKPRVRVFYSLADQRPVASRYLTLSGKNNGVMTIETPESLGPAVMQHLRGSQLRAA